MISRRLLIGSGLAVSALGFAGSRAAERSPGPWCGPRATHLLIDTRFDDAHAIARVAAVPGLELLGLPRDVLELWHDQLVPAHAQARLVLAGVTTESGLFLLSTLAADHRLRLRFAARHEAPRSGRIAHDIKGPAGQVAGCRIMSRPWPSVIGPALRHCQDGRQARMQFTSSARGMSRRDETLVSWVIGPALRG